MKKAYLVFLLMFATLSAYAEELKWEKCEDQMRHFRTLDQLPIEPNCSHVGLENRHLSGSGQFSAMNFHQLTDHVSKLTQKVDRLVIIDTRMESHGFINGQPIRWKANPEPNLGCGAQEIIQNEKSRLMQLFRMHAFRGLIVDSAVAEEELISLFAMRYPELCLEYVRMPTLDHCKPDDATVAAFLELIKYHPHSWLHVHCHVGKGRTTTFMALYDMFFNAKKLSFEEIIARQREIGGQDLIESASKASLSAERQAAYQERLKFLREFYRYCHEADLNSTSWIDWLNRPLGLKSAFLKRAELVEPNFSANARRWMETNKWLA